MTTENRSDDIEIVPGTKISENLSIVLENYVDMNTERSKEKNRFILDALDEAGQGIGDFLTSNYNSEIWTNYSKPQGNWPDVAWIAFGGPKDYIDNKGTFSINANIQMIADRSGILLVLLPFVKGEWKARYGNNWLSEFEPYRKKFREDLKWVEENGFILGNDVDLATNSSSGLDMRDGYIFYKKYSAKELPPDAELQKDIAVLFSAQQQLVNSSRPGLTWALAVKNGSSNNPNGD